MVTTSTVVTARQALVDALGTGELLGKVYFQWPGPDADGEHELVWVDGIADWEQTIPNVKAGRMQRQESYRFVVPLVVAQPEGESDGLKLAMERALALSNVIENALADDVQLDATAVQRFELVNRSYEEEPYERGWTVRIVHEIEVHARLT